MENEHVHPPAEGAPKSTTQMISIGVGFALFVLGLCGLLFSSFAGLHLGAIHSLIISAAGGILFYNGSKDYSWESFLCCLGFGFFFGVYSVLGFLLGAPGTPAIGYEGMDPYHLKIIPGLQELGQADHILNGVIAIVLLGGAYDWFGKHNERTVRKRLLLHRKRNYAH